MIRGCVIWVVDRVISQVKKEWLTHMSIDEGDRLLREFIGQVLRIEKPRVVIVKENIVIVRSGDRKTDKMVKATLQWEHVLSESKMPFPNRGRHIPSRLEQLRQDDFTKRQPQARIVIILWWTAIESVARLVSSSEKGGSRRGTEWVRYVSIGTKAPFAASASILGVGISEQPLKPTSP